jgi:hypothetical protein
MPIVRRCALLSVLAMLAGGEASAQTRSASGESAPKAGPPAARSGSGQQGAPSKKGAAETPKPPSVTGGYSWSEKKKPRRVRRRAHRVKFDPNAPNVTFPGFRMLPNGTSMVWVVVSKRVAVDVQRAKGRVVYVLRGAAVRTRNNTNPLITRHFNTPLARTRVVRHKAGAQLVLELREAAEPSHRILDGPRGMMVLQVTLPRASRSYAPAKDVVPLGVGRVLPTARGASKQAGSKAKSKR